MRTQRSRSCFEPSYWLPLALLVATAGARGQEAPAQAATTTTPVPTDTVAKIRAEGLERSKVMETASYLTDVIGPRLTNSPGMKRANEWTRDTMAGYGLENAHLEPWGPFGRGWSLKRFSAQVLSPQCIPLIGFPKAWSTGTNGTVIADVVHFDAKTPEEAESYRGRLAGKIVLFGDPRDVKAWFDPMAKRETDTELLEMANAPNPLEGQPTGGERRRRPQPSEDDAKRMATRRRMGELLRAEPPAVLIDPSFTGDGGTLFVHSATVEPGVLARSFRRVWNKETPAAVPQITLAIEHYNRLVRMLRQGEKLTMAVELAVEFHDEDPMGYNTVAEIPGTDRKDEVVMLGGHLDSWHAGTGATDNAAGCVVAMEAVRILKALDLKPRRTIRVALWSGEEQGLLGSRAYVKQHFGSVEAEPLAAAVAAWVGGSTERKFRKTPEYENFCGYFNYDNGTGKIRGIHMEGNEAVRPIFRRWLAPFKDLGASTLAITRTGGTDHMSFDAIGLPGFQFIQDSIDYDARTHHSNQDVYDRLQADDLKQASVIMATFVYQAAMADEKLPRKPEPKP